MKSTSSVLAVVLLLAITYACSTTKPKGVETDPAVRAQRAPVKSFDDRVDDNAKEMLKEGKRIFRYDTFGSEDFWGGSLRLHEAILGEKLGGVGPGVTARQALQLGLKADIAALPKILVEVLRTRAVDLDKVETTLELLRANSVVGVTGVFDKDSKKMTGIGIQCALCHSTVDDSFAKGIGRRLDGWPNRDLNVGAIVASAPTLKPFADLLSVDEGTVRRVLMSWGPGRYDAELNHDGKAMRPDGKPAATLLPAAFGLAGVNLHTYTGWGTVTYWNAYVANTQMYWKGTFFDPTLDNREECPIAARAGIAPRRGQQDRVSAIAA